MRADGPPERPLQLHDIDDVESYTAPIAQRYGSDLEWLDRQELHVFLIETAWFLSVRHDGSRGEFTAWLGHKLAQRSVDWRRHRFGRTRWKFSGGRTFERERPQLVSLDSDDASVGALVGRSGVDDREHRVADQLRALAARGRRPGRRNDWLGDDAA